MKNLTINYNIFNDKINKNIVSIADLHNYPGGRKTTLIDDIEVLEPDYILIAGDILRGSKYIIGCEEYKNLCNFLREMSEICPVLLGLGNHDLFNPSAEFSKAFKNLSSVRAGRVFALNNESAISDDIRIVEFHPSHSAFSPSIQESGRALLQFAEEFERNAIVPSENDKLYNILICHNPIAIKQLFSSEYLKSLDISKEQFEQLERVANMLKRFDLINCSHLHNGYMSIESVLKNPEHYLDYGCWEMPMEKNIDGKITFIRPWVFKKTDMCRGTIYIGADGKKLILMPTGEYFYRIGENEKYELVDEQSATQIIDREKLTTPIVIDGGINKYFNLPVGKSEITNIKILKR